MILQNQKQLFNFPKEITYLNIASQSPSFKSVEKAGVASVLKKSQPYKITGADYFEPVIQLKKLFAQLIEVDDYNRIAMIPSVSYGIATVANNIKLNAGDEILLIDEQFPSNFYSWEKLAKKYDATINFVKQPSTEIDCGKQWNSDILKAINKKTALVAMGNIHWANGTLFDLKAIREKTSQHNALLIIDGSQSVGALPFSVKEINPDALICAGYKWLFGPYGCGYGYFSSYFDDGNPIEENWSNRLDSENFTNLTNYQPKYKPLANRYSAGESGSFIYVQMQIAALKQIIEWTPKSIQDYCKDVSRKAIIELQKLGCTLEKPEDRTHHLFGFQLPNNTNIKLLKEKLNEQQIFVSFRGDFIRVSCHLYTTINDFKNLTECLKSIL